MAATYQIKSELLGLDKARQATSLFGRRAVFELGAALYRQAEDLMTKAKLETPVEFGNLRASGHVRKPRRVGELVEVQLGFGGIAGVGNHGGKTNEKAVGYAVYVHENMQASHTKKDKSGTDVQIGKAKYLEDPYRAKLATIDSEMAADLYARLIKKAA